MAHAIFVRLLVFTGLLAPAGVWAVMPYRFSRIAGFDYSPDGKQLAVVRIDAEDAQVPSEHHLANLARTISLVEVQSAQVNRVIERDFVRGNHGTARSYWQQSTEAIAFDAEGRSLFIRDFAGTEIRRRDLDSGESRPFFTPPQGSSLSGMCISPDRTRLAVASRGWIALVDGQTGEQLIENREVDAVAIYAGLLALSPDGRWLAVASGANLWLCDADNRLERGLPVACQGPFVFVPGRQQVAAVTGNDINYFGFDGSPLQESSLDETIAEPTFAHRGNIHALAFTPDGRQLIAAVNDLLLIGPPTRHVGHALLSEVWATTLACSPDGKTLAVDGADGGLLLVDLAHRSARRVAIPGGDRFRWPLAVSFLCPLVTCGWMARQWWCGRAIFPPPVGRTHFVLAVGFLLGLGMFLLASLR